MSASRVVIAGGSGFLGVSLANHLSGLEREVTILSRNPPPVPGPWRHVSWDARTLDAWASELDGTAGLVNLVGRTVDCVKTPDNRDEIVRSRVESTRVLGEAMRSLSTPPPTWVQMSTAHIYGDPPSLTCTEDSPYGVGLAPLVGRLWEEEFERAALSSQRRVVLRTSFVVGRDRGAGGGALDRLRPLARLGLGGRVGKGTQGMSWIHETDMNRLFERGLFDESMTGTYIASSPHPVSQTEFMRALRKAVRMPVGLPTPSWAVRIAAPLLLRTDPSSPSLAATSSRAGWPKRGSSFDSRSSTAPWMIWSARHLDRSLALTTHSGASVPRRGPSPGVEPISDGQSHC